MAAAGSSGSGGSIDLSLQGLTVVVTGAASGIGGAARLLGAAGASVVLAGRREALLRECADAIGQAGGRVFCVPADLADPASPGRIISAVNEAFGHIDGLVNNAAVCRHLPLPEWDMTAGGPGPARPDRRYRRGRTLDRALAEPGVVVHDGGGDPAGRGTGDPACLTPD